MSNSCAASLKLPQRAAASNKRKPLSGGISPMEKVIRIHRVLFPGLWIAAKINPHDSKCAGWRLQCCSRTASVTRCSQPANGNQIVSVECCAMTPSNSPYSAASYRVLLMRRDFLSRRSVLGEIYSPSRSSVKTWARQRRPRRMSTAHPLCLLQRLGDGLSQCRILRQGSLSRYRNLQRVDFLSPSLATCP